MADFDLNVESDGNTIRLFSGNGTILAARLLRDAVDDIGEQIEQKAKDLAPRGKTGALKEHPVDRDEASGFVATDFPLIGGGFAGRGPGGLFVKGLPFSAPGRVVARQTITVARIPKHAVWVHDGTGIYGPHRSPIVPRRAKYLKFEYKGRIWRLKSVRGQRAQPFLTDAFLIINRTYVPARVELLRAELAAVT